MDSSDRDGRRIRRRLRKEYDQLKEERAELDRLLRDEKDRKSVV